MIWFLGGASFIVFASAFPEWRLLVSRDATALIGAILLVGGLLDERLRKIRS